MSDNIHDGTEVVKPIEKLLEQLSVDTVFGKPVKEGDITIIPVAEVKVGFGYGWGQGTFRGSKKSSEQDSLSDNGNGAGAGAVIKAMPRGYICISPKAVKFKPINNKHYVKFAGIALLGLLIYLFGKLIDRKENKGQGNAKKIFYKR